MRLYKKAACFWAVSVKQTLKSTFSGLFIKVLQTIWVNGQCLKKSVLYIKVLPFKLLRLGLLTCAADAVVMLDFTSSVISWRWDGVSWEKDIGHFNTEERIFCYPIFLALFNIWGVGGLCHDWWLTSKQVKLEFYVRSDSLQYRLTHLQMFSKTDRSSLTEMRLLN